MARKQFIPCEIKSLKPKEQYAAAQFAISLNPVNRVPMELDKAAIAVMTSKYFGAEGVNLTVGFLSNASAALADRILSHFNAWGEHCNVNFTMHSGAASRAQIRISLGSGGYYSYLGTDCLRIPSGQQTMNLQGFSMQTSEAEFRRVVRHEVGHTLGCPHEHMRGEIVARLHEGRTIQYFRSTQGWSEQEVRQQVLTPISEASIMGTEHAEQNSCMCYQLPGSITKDGKPIVGGSDITPTDGAFMGKVYPKEIITPPPPPDATTRRIVLDVKGMTASIVSVT